MLNVDPALSSIVCTASSDAELPMSNVGNPSGSATVRFSNLNPYATRLTMSMAAATADQTAAISFTTSTPLAASDTIVLTFPAAGHVTAQATNQCGISTTSAMVADPHTITLTLSASNTLAAGAVAVAAVASGVIGGAVTSISFDSAAGERVAGRANVAATFAFTPSAGGGSPSSVTLNYPLGFFSTSATPIATSSSAGTILTPHTPGVTSIVFCTPAPSGLCGWAVPCHTVAWYGRGRSCKK